MIGISPKVMLGVTGIIILFILFSLAQEMNRRLQVQREIVSLEQEAREVEKSLIAMENLNQYFRTDAFQERMAREKLNYRAEGEKVVLITEDYQAAEVETQAVSERVDSSIPWRWWQIFFGDNLRLN